MTTRSFPNVRPSEASWQLVSNQRQMVSPHTKAIQTEQRGGQHWLCTLAFRGLVRAELRALQAFIGVVISGADNFTMPAFGHFAAGTGAGNPRVRGESQTGTELATDGWTTSAAGVLLAGAMISVGGELKQVGFDVDADAGGLATVTISPEIHQSPDDNSLIVTSAPTGIFRLVMDAAGWDLGALALDSAEGSITLVCMEDVLA